MINISNNQEWVPMKRHIGKVTLGVFALVAFTCKFVLADDRPDKNINNIWHIENTSDTVFVFVHGIFSDSRGAWAAGESEEASYWPSLIRDDEVFSGPSIFLGGFYTELNSNIFDFEDAANQLYQAMATGVNPVLSKRNIVFITQYWRNCCSTVISQLRG